MRVKFFLLMVGAGLLLLVAELFLPTGGILFVVALLAIAVIAMAIARYV